MEKITLQDLLKDMLKAQMSLDTSSSAIYVKAMESFKDCKSYPSTLKGLKDVVLSVSTELNMPKAFSSRAINVLALAGRASEYKLHTLIGNSNLLALYFYNIDKAVNLLNYIREHKSEDVMTTVKNKLNKIKKVEDKTAYNDAYSKELVSLYKEHKIVLTADGSVLKVDFNNLDVIVKQFKTVDDIEGMIEMLLARKNEIIEDDKE